MDKLTKHIIIAGSIIAASVIAIIIYKRTKKPKYIEPEQPEDTSIVPTVVFSSTWPLKQGSGKNEGEKALVRTVQKYLNRQGANLVVDGIFGPKTREALLYYTDKTEVTEEHFNRMLSYITGTQW
jgi:hypothetical protein